MGRRTYRTLDGLRGYAALAVVLFHAHPLLGDQFVAGGYLAVDLFFVLSGFVIAHAYEQRLDDNLSWPRFLQTRLARFYPLYLLGLMLGCVKLGASLVAGLPAPLSARTGTVAAVLNLLFIPAPFDLDGNLFPLNVPSWSLFYELLVNMLYAAILFRLPTRGLILIVIASAIVLAATIADQGSVNVGAYYHLHHVAGGIARTLFSFSIGLIIYRNRTPLSTFNLGPRGVLLCFAALTLALFVPVTPRVRPVFDMVCVLLICPGILVLGCATEPNPRLWSFFKYLGAISYCIYAIHYPLIDLAQGAMKVLHLPGPALVVALFTGLLIASPSIDRYYDRPFGRLLSRSRLTSTREATLP